MRNAFIDELVLAAESNPRIVLVVGDLGYKVVEPFAKKFPNQFFNSGVAEQNMMGLSAGLASEGYHVFVYSIANFPTFRCAEQLRNDVDYHKLPVTVVCVGGGLSYGNLGYSHHAIQDYALIRAMPNMLIASPGDPFEVKACMRYLIKNPQPSYLRLGKAGEICIHADVPIIRPGEWLPIVNTKKESNSAVLTTGATLALGHAWILSNPLFLNKQLWTMPLWGMQYKSMQEQQVSAFDSVTTIEDHLIDGGFGSWMLESLIPSTHLLQKIRIKALNPVVCGLVGNQSELNSIGGLNPC
jgi:transketolase